MKKKTILILMGWTLQPYEGVETNDASSLARRVIEKLHITEAV
jgi:hypothetical protein